MASRQQVITGDDTLTIFDRVITDLADGDVGKITFPNELVTVKTGKNKNSIYALKADGQNCELVIRILRGSADDKFLNSKYINMKNNLPAFVLGDGQFVKNLGDGAGNITKDTYDLSGGVFTKPVEAAENVDGDVNQAVAVYTMKFTLGERSLA